MIRNNYGHYTTWVQIGKGSHGNVYKAMGREYVAIKVIEKKKVAAVLPYIYQEIKILQSVSHPNIVKYIEHEETTTSISIVMEYCAGGDLKKYIQKRGHLNEDEIRKILHQVVTAICYLYKNKFMHRDLKPDNFLLSNDCIKLADFGLARQFQTEDLASTQCGTPLYMAPEIFDGKPYDIKADLWSIGCILYEMVTGKLPFTASNREELIWKINEKYTKPNCSYYLNDLLEKLLAPNPVARISLLDLLSHPFLKEPQVIRKTYTPSPTRFSNSLQRSIHQIQKKQTPVECNCYFATIQNTERYRELIQRLNFLYKCYCTVNELVVENKSLDTYCINTKCLVILTECVNMSKQLLHIEGVYKNLVIIGKEYEKKLLCVQKIPSTNIHIHQYTNNLLYTFAISRIRRGTIHEITERVSCIIVYRESIAILQSILIDINYPINVEFKEKIEAVIARVQNRINKFKQVVD